MVDALVESVMIQRKWGYCYLELFEQQNHYMLAAMHKQAPLLSDIKESSEVYNLVNVPRYVSWEYFPNLTTIGSPAVLLHIHKFQVSDNEVAMMPRDILNISFPSLNEEAGSEIPILIGAETDGRSTSVPVGDKPSLHLMQPIPRSLSQNTGFSIAENLERLNFEETSRLLSLLPSPTSEVGSSTSYGVYNGHSTWSLTPSPMVWTPSINDDYVNGVGMTPYHDKFCYLAVFNPHDWDRMAIKLGPRPWWNEFKDAVLTATTLSGARFLLFQMINPPTDELEGGNLLHLVLSPPGSQMGFLAQDIPWNLYDSSWRVGTYFYNPDGPPKDFVPYTRNSDNFDPSCLLLDRKLTKMRGKPVYKPVRADLCNYCQRVGTFNVRKSPDGCMLLYQYADRLWCKTCRDAFIEEESELEYEKTKIRCEYMYCEDEHDEPCPYANGFVPVQSKTSPITENLPVTFIQKKDPEQVYNNEVKQSCCSDIVCFCYNPSSVYTPLHDSKKTVTRTPKDRKTSEPFDSTSDKKGVDSTSKKEVHQSNPRSYASILKKDGVTGMKPGSLTDIKVKMVRFDKPILHVAVKDLPPSIAPSISTASSFEFENDSPLVNIPKGSPVIMDDVPIYEFEPINDKITIRLPGSQILVQRELKPKTKSITVQSSYEDRSSDSGYSSDESKWTEVTYTKSTKTERKHGVRSNIYYRIGRDIEVRPQSISDCISISQSRDAVTGRISDVIEDKYFNITLKRASIALAHVSTIYLRNSFSLEENYRQVGKYKYQRPYDMTQAIEISINCDKYFRTYSDPVFYPEVRKALVESINMLECSDHLNNPRKSND